ADDAALAETAALGPVEGPSAGRPAAEARPAAGRGGVGQAAVLRLGDDRGADLLADADEPGAGIGPEGVVAAGRALRAALALGQVVDLLGLVGGAAEAGVAGVARALDGPHLVRRQDQ